jgi:L-threonylcarbamoyladenylate synthase
MKIFKVGSLNPNINSVKQAANALTNNGLIIYPTDTAYGLGANALKTSSIKKVYNTKKRDFIKPTHVIVRDWKMIEDLTYTNHFTKKLFNNFLPGPLTLILKKKSIIFNLLTSNLPTLGIRIPDNNITRLLSRLVDFPYTTPSANLSGEKTPYSLNDINNNLLTKVDVILDSGKLKRIKTSTIIDISSPQPKILRKGPISIKEIENTLQTKLITNTHTF